MTELADPVVVMPDMTETDTTTADMTDMAADMADMAAGHDGMTMDHGHHQAMDHSAHSMHETIDKEQNHD